VVPLLVSCTALAYWTEVFTPGKREMKQASSVLGHSFQDALGKTVSMDSLLGKAVLVVNVASE
jgi:hypothetical protein